MPHKVWNTGEFITNITFTHATWWTRLRHVWHALMIHISLFQKVFFFSAKLDRTISTLLSMAGKKWKPFSKIDIVTWAQFWWTITTCHMAFPIQLNILSKRHRGVLFIYWSCPDELSRHVHMSWWTITTCHTHLLCWFYLNPGHCSTHQFLSKRNMLVDSLIIYNLER